MRIHACTECGHAVYFHNTQCTRCHSALAFDPISLSMHARTGQLCANGQAYQACNWLADADSPAGFCVACELNRTIPNLADERNLQLWRKVQAEKNRLVYSLLRLRLPVVSQHVEPDTGLAFDILDARNEEDGNVTTGHAWGVITLNIDEADDAIRERVRQQMGEPYRTLLGHFRHESAHYYWDRLVSGQHWLGAFRELFGDDRQDYPQALKDHYNQGAPFHWAERYISSYASAHPWEDWAETWAHYFHIVDTLETAWQLGLTLDPLTGRAARFDVDTDPYACADIQTLVELWLPVSLAVNMLNRSLGQPDAYPFVLTPVIQQKLGLIHEIVSGHGSVSCPPAIL